MASHRLSRAFLAGTARRFSGLGSSDAAHQATEKIGAGYDPFLFTPDQDNVMINDVVIGSRGADFLDGT